MFNHRALTFVLAVLWLLPAAAHGQSSALIDAYNRYSELYPLGRYQEALPFAEKAVRLGKQEFGPDHAIPAIHINHLAELYRFWIWRSRYEARAWVGGRGRRVD